MTVTTTASKAAAADNKAATTDPALDAALVQVVAEQQAVLAAQRTCHHAPAIATTALSAYDDLHREPSGPDLRRRAHSGADGPAGRRHRPAGPPVGLDLARTLTTAVSALDATAQAEPDPPAGAAWRAGADPAARRPGEPAGAEHGGSAWVDAGQRRLPGCGHPDRHRRDARPGPGRDRPGQGRDLVDARQALRLCRADRAHHRHAALPRPRRRGRRHRRHSGRRRRG